MLKYRVCILTATQRSPRSVPHHRQLSSMQAWGCALHRQSCLASPGWISCRYPVGKILARSRHLDRSIRPADLSGTRHRDVLWTFFFVHVGVGGLFLSHVLVLKPFGRHVMFDTRPCGDKLIMEGVYRPSCSMETAACCVCGFFITITPALEHKAFQVCKLPHVSHLMTSLFVCSISPSLLERQV